MELCSQVLFLKFKYLFSSDSSTFKTAVTDGQSDSSIKTTELENPSFALSPLPMISSHKIWNKKPIFLYKKSLNLNVFNKAMLQWYYENLTQNKVFCTHLIYLINYLFIYSFDRRFTSLSRRFYLYDGGQRYGESKPAPPVGNPRPSVGTARPFSLVCRHFNWYCNCNVAEYAKYF